LPCGETDCGYGPLRAIRNLDLVHGATRSRCWRRRQFSP